MMVLNHMLSNSPLFLFSMTAPLLAAYGVFRLVQALKARCTKRKRQRA